MRRLFDLLTLLLVCLLVAHCGGGGSGGTAAVTVDTVRVTPTAVGIGVGQTTVLTAEALAADGAVLLGKSFLFGSENAAVATVSVATAGANTATVRGVAVGSTTVTVTVDGKTFRASGITVTALAPTGPEIRVTGRVIDGETRAGLADAGVDFQLRDGTNALANTTTAADGSFSFNIPETAADAAGRASVNVTGRKAGYVSSQLLGAIVNRGGTQLETIELVRESATPGRIFGVVRNALDGNPVSGADVLLTRGQGPFSTESAGATVSDAGGGYSFPNLAVGTYTASAGATGFRNSRRTAITVASGSTVAQDIVISPGSGDDIRIVLTWGGVPADLDAHLTGPNPSDPGRFHVSFVNRLDARATPFAGLDRDDRDGFGPETVTITRLSTGVYRYSVHDFTNRSRGGSSELGQSGAKVELHTRFATQTFFVPNQAGNLWTVFELSGDVANPTVTPRNTMGVAEDFNTIP